MSDWDRRSQEFDRRPIWTGSKWVLGIGITALVLGLAFSAMAIFGVGFFQRATADFRGETGAIERIKADPDFRIATYNRFFDLCASVQAQEDRARNLEAEAKTASPERREQIQASITAVLNTRAESIRQYNADASKDFTAGIFRDLDLPFQLNINEEETTCAI